MFQNTYNHNLRSNTHQQKNHEKVTVRREGGSTLKVSRTVKYPFFYDVPYENDGKLNIDGNKKLKYSDSVNYRRK